MTAFFCIILVILIAVFAYFLPSKGQIGEYSVVQKLKKLPEEQYRVINDVLLPTSSGKTSQIDHIVVSMYGIFVIETKNYKGWIFGSPNAEYWTQSLYNRWGSEQHKFYNPLRQNAYHVKVLRQVLSDIPELQLIPIVCFLNNVEFKFDISRENLVYLYELNDFILSWTNPIYTEEQLNEIVQRIENTNITDKEEVAAHAQQVRQTQFRQEQKLYDGICPRCGGKLVLRSGKYGDFLGCSNYPNCRFTQKL